MISGMFYLLAGPEGLEAPAEVLNEKAIAVIRRVQDKLTGLDFGADCVLDVPAQVSVCNHVCESTQ